MVRLIGIGSIRLSREALFYRAYGMMQARANRADGDAERFRNFGIGKLMGKAQVQHLAVARRERFDRFPGEVESVVVRDLSFRSRLRFNIRVQHLAFAVAPLPGRPAHVPRDPEKVGARRFRSGAFFEALRHFHKSVLHKIPRRFRIPVSTGKIARQIFRRVPEELLEVRSLLYGVQGGQGSEEFSSST